MDQLIAPGAPGQKLVWTSAAKTGIGTAIDSASQVAFTLGDGTITEIYYPRLDKACIKDIQLVITNGEDFLSCEDIDCDSVTEMLKEGVPAYRVTNNCRQGKYSLVKEIVTDPSRSSLLQKVTFTKLTKEASLLHLYCLLNPHINNKGEHNNGKVGEYKGVPMLFAYADGIALALACSSPWLRQSVGYVGTSDSWTDLQQHKKMEWTYQKAEGGNILVAGEIDCSADTSFTLSVGFGRTETEAANRAYASLLDGFEFSKDRYISQWEQYHKEVTHIGKGKNSPGKLFQMSTAVLKISEAKSFPGGLIASISIPWGTVGGDSVTGGYHVVWPRDLVESCGGLLALDASKDALRIANYLMSTQEEDGKWYQNMWLGGDPYKHGIQMDQVAFPILLMDKCYRHKLLDKVRMQSYWPRIKKAISFLIKEGPSTKQDRWEEQEGLTPFTLAAEVAGLLAAANLAEAHNETALAEYCRQTADCWNSRIEDWTYVTDTDLARKHGVDGYYIRINPTCQPANEVKDQLIKVRDGLEGHTAVGNLVSVDALALVRFGLRAADDPRILNTIKVIDAELKIDTPHGPCWHRYNNDGYGEDPEGNPFAGNGKGKGRAWPLLTGERGHYELAAGNKSKAIEMLRAMEAFSNNGLISEQIWDTTDIPEKQLYLGQPTHSAMPLTWAHAEYIKLSCSILEKKIFDLPDYTFQRYVKGAISAPFFIWSFDQPVGHLPRNKTLRIQSKAMAKIRWTPDNWATCKDIDMTDTSLGIFIADLPAQDLPAETIIFTFFWPQAGHWENRNFVVQLQK